MSGIMACPKCSGRGFVGYPPDTGYCPLCNNEVVVSVVPPAWVEAWRADGASLATEKCDRCRKERVCVWVDKTASFVCAACYTLSDEQAYRRQT